MGDGSGRAGRPAAHLPTPTLVSDGAQFWSRYYPSTRRPVTGPSARPERRDMFGSLTRR
jgi:hypothetical protein